MSPRVEIRDVPPEWYELRGTPDLGIWWWAIEHLGHPAFYLRALMPGDFAPGAPGPRPRHVLPLLGDLGAGDPVTCGTCGLVVGAIAGARVEDLEPVERKTGVRGFLSEFRRGRVRWPKRTRDESCWECSSPRVRADREVALRVGKVKVCAGCARAIASRVGRG